MVEETPEIRLRRLRMRSWRRGMKEMDLILGPFADSHLAGLSEPLVQEYEDLLAENDQDLYLWVSGQAQTPPEHVSILDLIRARLG